MDAILVVGAGPTGLMTAGELARLGVPCRVIDKAAAPSQTSKALAVQARTLEYFERIGLADAAAAAGRKVHGANVFSGGRRIVHLTFDDISSRYPFALIFPQSGTERLLTDHLSHLGVEVERNAELVSLAQGAEGVEAVVRRTDRGTEERVRAPWLIGCDGAHSAARHLLGVPFSGRAFEEAFSLADVRLESDLPADEVTIYLCKGDILGFFPMAAPGQFRAVIAHGRGTAPPGAPTLDEFQRAIDAFGPRGARVSDPAWTSRFRISQRQVAAYRRGRSFLVGDAAHIHSPLGGQGMNTGIQDACNLAWKLALVSGGRARDGLLDSYHAALLRVTGALSRVVLWRNPAAAGARDAAAALRAAHVPRPGPEAAPPGGGGTGRELSPKSDCAGRPRARPRRPVRGGAARRQPRPRRHGGPGGRRRAGAPL
jgi:2-polyprenyl-6-methoxyphenol hydroxylase-like FAD-dependent oxidoreductase